MNISNCNVSFIFQLTHKYDIIKKILEQSYVSIQNNDKFT